MSAVLLLAFRRWQNIDVILDECRMAGVARIYIHIDAGSSFDQKADVTRMFEKVFDYRKKWGVDIRIARQRENIGCAVSLILSLDAVFMFENRVIVLEDDCIPTPDFFAFTEESFLIMERNPKIGVTCGAQFAPLTVTQNKWLLSQYPFNWGWGTTKSQWRLLFSKMFEKEELKPLTNRVSREEATYWNAGARRALAGYTDVWDTLLVREMIRHELLSILPGKNLIRNVGNDAHALHTSGEQLWTNFPTGNFGKASSTPNFSVSFNQWARSQFFQISRRHLLSTRFTWLLDKLVRKPMRESLPVRIQFAAVNFDL